MIVNLIWGLIFIGYLIWETYKKVRRRTPNSGDLVLTDMHNGAVATQESLDFSRSQREFDYISSFVNNDQPYEWIVDANILIDDNPADIYERITKIADRLQRQPQHEVIILVTQKLDIKEYDSPIPKIQSGGKDENFGYRRPLVVT